MNFSDTYILLAIIVVLAITASIVIVRRRKFVAPLRPLAGIAFAFGLAGVLFIENRLIGYGLMAVGLLLAVIDIIKREKS